MLIIVSGLTNVHLPGQISSDSALLDSQFLPHYPPGRLRGSRKKSLKVKNPSCCCLKKSKGPRIIYYFCHNQAPCLIKINYYDGRINFSQHFPHNVAKYFEQINRDNNK